MYVISWYAFGVADLQLGFGREDGPGAGKTLKTQIDIKAEDVGIARLRPEKQANKNAS